MHLVEVGEGFFLGEYSFSALETALISGIALHEAAPFSYLTPVRDFSSAVRILSTRSKSGFVSGCSWKTFRMADVLEHP